jgi:hypothetical protein
VSSSLPLPASQVSPVVIETPARLLTLQKNSGSPDIRLFDSVAINKSIDNQMVALPAGKTVAAIAYVDRNGANIAIVGKIPGLPGQTSWTVLGTKEWSGNWNASAALRWSI